MRMKKLSLRTLFLAGGAPVTAKGAPSGDLDGKSAWTGGASPK